MNLVENKFNNSKYYDFIEYNKNDNMFLYYSAVDLDGIINLKMGNIVYY